MHLNRLPKAFVTLLMTCMIATALQAQQASMFTVKGPCLRCADHLLSTVKAMSGVNSATYDKATYTLSLDYNPTAASEIDIQLGVEHARL